MDDPNSIVLGPGSDWFGPGDPQTPTAPETAGRRFDYPVAFNIGTQRRDYATGGVTFEMLRGLADGYDLLRLVIETRKDQIAGLEWRIGPRKKQKGKGAEDPRCDAITEFFRYPDKVNDWDTWVRALAEELLVTDAATVYRKRNRGGGLFALELLDGATIRPLIDGQGRTPATGPAYRQILKGTGTAEYSMDELLYLPRNQRVWKVYGYSPVEQIIITVQIALRRQLHQLQYYTEGSVPDSLFTVPEGWTPEQIAEFQQWFVQMFSGNTANRRNGVFVPHGVVPINTKEHALKDDYDEWLARIVCYCFNVSPQWATKQMNRATSETADKQAQREGLEPMKRWFKRVHDRVIALDFGAPDLEFKWEEDVELSSKDQVQVNDTLLARGVKLINEVRDEMGLAPIPGGDTPLIFTATGAVRLEDVIKEPAAPVAPVAAMEPGQDPGSAKASKTPAFDRVEKAVKGASKDQAGVRNGRFEPRAKDVKVLSEIWSGFLSHGARECADACQPVEKAGNSDDDETERERIIRAVNNAIDNLPWSKIQQETEAVIADAATDAGETAMTGLAAETGLSASVSVSFGGVDAAAVAWAKQHAGELITMISDTTRQKIRDLVAADMAGEIKSTELAAKIMEAGAFSRERAELIALNEATRATNQGMLAGWIQSRDEWGTPIRKVWVLGLERNHCGPCEANAVVGPIDLDEEFPSGDLVPPAHPHCFCWMTTALGPEDEIVKSNPNHGWHGRFSAGPLMAPESGGAGGSGAANSAQSAKLAVEDALDNRQKKQFHEFGTLPRAKEIQRQTGFDVSEYKNGFTYNYARHIINTHGNPLTEAKRSPPQIAITPHDFGHIPDIMQRGKIEHQANGRIKFTARMNQSEYHYVAEVDYTQSRVHAITMFRKKL